MALRCIYACNNGQVFTYTDCPDCASIGDCLDPSGQCLTLCVADIGSPPSFGIATPEILDRCGAYGCCLNNGAECRNITIYECERVRGGRSGFLSGLLCEDEEFDCLVVSKRCCHCDWCCKVGTGGITETACTQAGGEVQSGTCPTSGPCLNAKCKPCLTAEFRLARNIVDSAVISMGYQPVGEIKGFDTSATTEAIRPTYPSLCKRDEAKGYAAELCTIYNRFIGGGNRASNTIGTDVTRRRAVSECALSSTSVAGNTAYQFVCAYREPCNESPAGCARAAA